MFSTLHDELYQFNLDSRRWYPVAVKAPAKALAKANKEAEALQGTKDGSTEAVSTSIGAAASSPDQTAHRDEPTASSGTGGAAQGGSAHAEGISPRECLAAGNDAEQVQPDLADKLSKAGVDKESALYKAAARIQSRFRGYTVRKVNPLHQCAMAGKWRWF